MNITAHKADPRPNEKIEKAVKNPLDFDVGNHKIMFLFGATYPQPSASPQQSPAPIYSNGRLCKKHAHPVNISPIARREEEIAVAFLMFFSASGPKNAAPIPRKKMFKQNANYVNAVGHPIAAVICGTNKLHA